MGPNDVSSSGSDIVEDDGVYSRYFSKFTGPGLYTVRLTATGFCPEGENSSQCKALVFHLRILLCYQNGTRFYLTECVLET